MILKSKFAQKASIISDIKIGKLDTSRLILRNSKKASIVEKHFLWQYYEHVSQLLITLFILLQQFNFSKKKTTRSTGFTRSSGLKKNFWILHWQVLLFLAANTISENTMTVVQLLLLLSGDVELNPGPPKRMARAPVKVEKKEEDIPPTPQIDYSEQFGSLETKVTEVVCPP